MEPQTTAGGLDELVFDNRFVRQLPADPDSRRVPRQVVGACFSRVKPVRVSGPELVAYSRDMAESLDLSAATCRSDDFVQVFAGNRLLAGMTPGPPATAVISSATGPASSATAGPPTWERSSPVGKSAGPCSSREPG